MNDTRSGRLAMAKTYSVLGDSISTFEGAVPAENRCYYDAADTNGTGVTSQDETWWARVIDAEDGELLANASFSGSMVQGDGFPAGRHPSRANQLLGDDGRAPDAVLVFIGINDYGWASPEAQFAGGSEAAPKGASYDLEDVDPAGGAPGDASERFEAAYAEMLANVREVAPYAEIWCVTLLPGRMARHAKGAFCYRLRGADLEEYNEAIRNAAENAGARVADVAELGFDYDAADGTHPTKEGMVQLAALVEAAMCKARDDEEGYVAVMRSYPERLRSSRFCDKPSCVGCPHASITRERWSCMCADRLTAA